MESIKQRSAFSIENLFDMSHVTLNHHINQALKANVSMHLMLTMLFKKAKLLLLTSLLAV